MWIYTRLVRALLIQFNESEHFLISYFAHVFTNMFEGEAQISCISKNGDWHEILHETIKF